MDEPKHKSWNRRQERMLTLYTRAMRDEADRMRIIAWVIQEGPHNLQTKVLFRKRMEFEGRGFEVEERYERLRPTVNSAETAMIAALKEMGYVSNKPRELRRWRAIILDARQRFGLLRNGPLIRNMAKKRTKVDEYIDTLPPAATAKQEAEYVIAHWKFRRAVELIEVPRMFGKTDLDEESMEAIDSLLPLTMHDVREAPSRQATTRLTHAIKFPKLWNDTLLMVAKAVLRKEQTAEAVEVDDGEYAHDDLSELDKLISAGRRIKAALEKRKQDE